MPLRDSDNAKWLARFSYLWAAFFVAVAVGIYGVGYTYPDHAYLKDIGSVVAGGSVAAILFNWLAQKSTENAIDLIVADQLSKIVLPIRNRAMQGALSDYRCFIRIEPPQPSDAGQDYLVQLVSLSYEWPEIPRQVKAVCAVSNAAGALKQWADDRESLILWKIETPGSRLVVAERTVFDIGHIQVNERKLSVGTGRIVDVNGGHAREITIRVPEDLVGKNVHVSVEVRARMHDAPSGRLFTAAQLYRPVINGEYFYTISDRIDASEVVPIHEMTPVVAGTAKPRGDRVWTQSGGGQTARIIFDNLMDRGSAIRFEWYKRGAK